MTSCGIRPLVRREDRAHARFLELHQQGIAARAERTDIETIAVAQGATCHSAEATAQISCSASENNRHVDSTRDGEPCPASLRRNRNLFPASNDSSTPARNFRFADLHIKRPAAPCDDSIILELQTRGSHGELESRH